MRKRTIFTFPLKNVSFTIASIPLNFGFQDAETDEHRNRYEDGPIDARDGRAADDVEDGSTHVAIHHPLALHGQCRVRQGQCCRALI